MYLGSRLAWDMHVDTHEDNIYLESVAFLVVQQKWSLGTCSWILEKNVTSQSSVREDSFALCVILIAAILETKFISCS